MWVAMNIGPICFVLLACYVLWRSARPGGFGVRPKSKPEMTPWHPERGRQAKPLLVFYMALYGPVFLFFLAWAAHGAHKF
jgi:hypothetical protein